MVHSSHRKFGHPALSRKSGVALVIVLAFVVLLTGLVLAFFSRASADRSISSSSANQTRAELLAQGALNQLLGDLKQEIVAGSTVTGTAATVYVPKSPASAVPARSGTLDPAVGTLAPNVTKRSAFQQAFYAGSSYDVSVTAAPNRASLAPSDAPSLNGRSISPARWNKPLLLPRKTATSTTDYTPMSTGSTAFVAPDWVFVARDGSNPVLSSDADLTAAVRTSSSNATSITGRYAYTIYDEGGLLDMNVVGYPSTVTGTDAAFSSKSMPAFADLSKMQVPISTGSNISISSADVGKVVAWRNSATAPLAWTAASATNYIQSLRGNSSGFLNVMTSGGASDRTFVSRRALIEYFTGGTLSTPNALNVLPYLGTFTRSLEQPSFIPALIRTGTGAVVSNEGSDPYTNYAGGNNAYGVDSKINPALLTVAVTTAFTRNDGTTAKVGEPLVKKRFALENLAWITYKGPSAARSTSDPDMARLLTFPEVTPALLSRGTASNIQKYFGLIWNGAQWEYAPPGSGTVVGAITRLENLSGREPNLVELLKATINVGSLGKSTGLTTTLDYYFDQAARKGVHLQETSVDAHILQIVANLIDQADADGFPTTIKYASTSALTRYFAGIEDLPYFYRIRHLPVTAATGTYTGTLTLGTVTYPGRGLLFIVPEIWNPHDRNTSRGTPRPTEFRSVADNVINYPTPAQATGSGLGGAASIYTEIYDPSFAAPNTNRYTFNPSINFPNLNLTPDNSALLFEDTTGILFREPVSLVTPNVPRGSNLRVATTHQLANAAISTKIVAADGVTPLIKLDAGYPGSYSVKDVVDNQSTDQGAIGFLAGVYPLLRPQNATTDSAITQFYNGYFSVRHTADTATFRMQYNRGTAGVPDWVDYDTKFWNPHRQSPLVWSFRQHGASIYNTRRIMEATGSSGFFDPRTGRFGMFMADGTGYALDAFAPDLTAFSVSRADMLKWQNNYGNSMATNRPGCQKYANMCLVKWDDQSFFHFSPAAGFPDVPVHRIYYDGIFAQNNPLITDNGLSSPAYTDPDGVIRKGMGAYTTLSGGNSGTTTGNIGLPTVTATTFSGSNPPTTTVTTQSQSRPVILNRPFRSVAELGYVFRDVPWHHLDFFTPESGDAGLLDVFCIHDSSNSDGLIAGKVNLNTRNAPVLQAVLAGAFADELTSGAITQAEALALANVLVARTATTPLSSVADLVGTPTGGNAYSGFSADLTGAYSGGAAGTRNLVQRFREGAVRALSNCGQTRVWNLMIDLVAQTGTYPRSASRIDQFVVTGETRRWLHIAIDRTTGTVLDSQVELVTE